MPLWHLVPVRPLAAGAAIWCPSPGANDVGTLGMILARNGGYFAITCRHVIASSNAGIDAIDGSVVLQPAAAGSENVIGRIDSSLVSTELDAAAIPIESSLGVSLDAGGLVRGMEFTAAVDGRAVFKVGAHTGITNGVALIDGVSDRMRIEPAGGGGRFAERGDSGSVWFEAGTGNPVALHTGTGWTPAGRRMARVIEIGRVIAALGL